LGLGLPFPVKIPQPNKETLAPLKEAEDIRKKIVNSESKSVEDFVREMDT
jgi:antitoxin component of RelBE/YafQ-DinJ toxin-antitoxin module